MNKGREGDTKDLVSENERRELEGKKKKKRKNKRKMRENFTHLKRKELMI